MMKNGLSIGDRAQHHWRTTIDEYIGLDVSMKETAISVRRDGKRIWRHVCLGAWAHCAGDLHRCAPRQGCARHGCE